MDGPGTTRNDRESTGDREWMTGNGHPPTDNTCNRLNGLALGTLDRSPGADDIGL